MTYTIGTIRTFKTANFRVTVDAIAEELPDLSWDETGEVTAGIRSGRYVVFCARARVFYKGHELARDYLGNCIHESPESFQDHRECGAMTRKLRAEGSTATCGSYFADMVRNVCQDARKELRDMKGAKVRT